MSRARHRQASLERCERHKGEAVDVECDLKAGHAECRSHAFVDPSASRDAEIELISQPSAPVTKLCAFWFDLFAQFSMQTLQSKARRKRKIE